MASSPSRNLGGGDWNTADLAALFTSSSPVDLPFWFVPCAQEPQAGQKVTVLGYGGEALPILLQTFAQAKLHAVASIGPKAYLELVQYTHFKPPKSL